MSKTPKSTVQDKKKDDVGSILESIQKKFQKDDVFIITEQTSTDVETISTGSIGLDLALGVGGLPMGRIVEIYGPESSGKTTLMLSLIAQAQKQGKVCAFVDAEHALDPTYATRIGVDLSKLLMTQPESAEKVLEITASLVNTGKVGVIVVDSVAALIPQAEINGDIGDSHVGVVARLMGQGLRKLVPAANTNNCLIVFINQLRAKIGNSYGPQETTTGGNSLKFFSSVRLDIRRVQSNKDSKGNVLSNTTKVKVIKNKVAPPFKEAVFEIKFNHGINKMAEILDLGAIYKIFEKSGSWFSYEGEKIGNGRVNAADWLEKNPEICNQIEQKIKDIIKANNDIILIGQDVSSKTNDNQADSSEDQEDTGLFNKDNQKY